MGVYIKGLDMPSNCGECKLPYEICWFSYRTDIRWRHERYENCPLVEVKAPHGDLIDRDVLETEVYTMTEWNGDLNRVVYEATVDKAPTVIEAED